MRFADNIRMFNTDDEHWKYAVSKPHVHCDVNNCLATKLVKCPYQLALDDNN